MAKCKATTKAGKRCKANAIGSLGRCLFHSTSNRTKRFNRKK